MRTETVREREERKKDEQKKEERDFQRLGLFGKETKWRGGYRKEVGKRENELRICTFARDRRLFKYSENSFLSAWNFS